MSNKSLKERRIMSYFIEAIIDLMDKEDVESITIRKIADAAGYNSATLYNYFDNLDHLIVYASVSRLKEYIRDLPNYMSQADNAFEEYLAIWECFSKHAFQLPDFYYRVFFGKLSSSTPEVIRRYYDIFPEELEGLSLPLIGMLTEGNIFQRNRKLLEKCAAEDMLETACIDEINELSIFFFKGLLSELVEKKPDWKPDRQAEKAMYYMRKIFLSCGSGQCEIVSTDQ